MTVYIYSTLTSSNKYTFYKRFPNGQTAVEKEILIAGGANVADKHFITPRGVSTPVSDEDFEKLQSHPVFKKHVANGFIRFSKVKEDADKVAKDLEEKDKSAPLTEETIGQSVEFFENEEKPKRGRKKKG